MLDDDLSGDEWKHGQPDPPPESDEDRNIRRAWATVNRERAQRYALELWARIVELMQRDILRGR